MKRAAVILAASLTIFVLSNEKARAEQTIFTQSELDVLNSLAAREDELNRKARRLEIREAEIGAVQSTAEARIGELQSLEKRLMKMLDQRDEEEERRLAGLARSFEAMRPGEAAERLAALNEPLVLSLALRMRQEALGRILARMPVDRAATIAVQVVNSVKADQGGG